MASHPLHIAAAFHTFFSADGRKVRVDIDVDDGAGHTESIRAVRFGIISKTTPYTHLGRIPIHVNRNASLDSRLSLTAFTQLRALSLIGGAASAMRKGKFLHGRKDVVQLDDLARLHVRAEEPFPYQVDGDDVGDTDELRIGLEPTRSGLRYRRQHHVGNVRDDDVDAGIGERPRRRRDRRRSRRPPARPRACARARCRRRPRRARRRRRG